MHSLLSLSNEQLGYAGLVALIVLCFLGVRIAFALAGLGIVGLALLRDWDVAVSQAGVIAFSEGRNYVLIAIPLFIFMGNIAYEAGLPQSAFEFSRRILQRFRTYGTGIATVLGCGIFAASSGSSVANSAVMARVAIPEMITSGLRKEFAGGIVGAGGTLGILIPPSTSLIIYGAYTETSVGDLFIAGILPGIMMIVLYSLAVIATIRSGWGLDPVDHDIVESGTEGAAGHPIVDVASGSETKTLPETRDLSKLATVRLAIELVPLLLVFASILGSIYAGIATPTEAAAIGCGAVIIAGMLNRRLGPRRFRTAILETCQITGMIFAVLIGGYLFSVFIVLTGVPRKLVSSMAEAGLGPTAALIVVLLGLALLGTFLEPLPMMVISLPLLIPMMNSFEWDRVWFGILMVMLLELALISPPVGMNLFVISGSLKDVSADRLFIGVLPMVGALVLGLSLIAIFPGIPLALVN